MNRQSVDLHIEELALEGFAPGDRAAIAEAVERELARLLAEQGVPPSLARGGEAARLDGGTFAVTPGSPPDAIGGEVARAVFGGLAR